MSAHRSLLPASALILSLQRVGFAKHLLPFPGVWLLCCYLCCCCDYCHDAEGFGLCCLALLGCRLRGVAAEWEAAHQVQWASSHVAAGEGLAGAFHHLSAQLEIRSRRSWAGAMTALPEA